MGGFKTKYRSIYGWFPPRHPVCSENFPNYDPFFAMMCKSSQSQIQVKSKSAWLCIKSSQVQVRSLKKLTKSSQVHVMWTGQEESESESNLKKKPWIRIRIRIRIWILTSLLWYHYQGEFSNGCKISMHTSPIPSRVNCPPNVHRESLGSTELTLKRHLAYTQQILSEIRCVEFINSDNHGRVCPPCFVNCNNKQATL